jgi:hypothetical protein
VQGPASPDGTACNDHDACTKPPTSAGARRLRGGAAVAGCTLYLKEDFEVCPNGWTLGGDWGCGTPENVGPPLAHTGNGVLATDVSGVYSVSQSFNTAVADSPSIDLTLATNPMLSFWAWDHTEGGTFDGWNLKVSTNGGAVLHPGLDGDPGVPADHLRPAGVGWQPRERTAGRTTRPI